jgi:glucose/arabinose dehydrogenase
MRFTDHVLTLVPVLAMVVGCTPSFGDEPDGFIVREGYSVKTLVPNLRGCRFMEFGPAAADGSATLYVSRMTSEITSFKYANGELTQLGTFVSKMPTVHGLCYHDGWLWFSTADGIHKAKDKGDGTAGEVVSVLSGLPGRSGHWWRSILVTDDSIYTSVGDPQNIGDETNTDREKIWKYTLDGKSRELFCSGIRNTEKLRIRPGSDEIWGLDHGSDWFGRNAGDREGDQPITDLNPPDEFNRYVKGGFYGHPFIVGNRLPRYEYLDRKDIHELAKKTIPPEWAIGAHWATNGWCFVDPALNEKTKALPSVLSGDAIIACHGSWNSSNRVGYCIARIMFDKDSRFNNGIGRPIGLEKLVSTLDSGGKNKARPVDCVQAPDGSILFSSDEPGRIYRLTWVGDAVAGSSVAPGVHSSDKK